MISLVLSFCSSVVLGIYLSIIASRMIDGNSFYNSLVYDQKAKIMLFFTILLFGGQIFLKFATIRKSNQSKKVLIEQILEEACKSLVYPHRYHIRAIITVCDRKRKKRKTMYGYNIGISPERFAEYDISFGVTGKAYELKRPVAEELPENHIDEYDEHHRAVVDGNLRCVLAAPIFRSPDDNDVIGILAFDSNETISKIRFNTDVSKEIAQNWADIVSTVLNY